MNQYKKLFKNTFAITIGNFSSKILVFLMLPLYTACLSTEEYGIVDLVYTSTNLLYPILTLLANEIALRFALEKAYDKEKVFSTVLKLHVGGFVLMLLFSPLLRFIPELYAYRVEFFAYYFCITLSNIVSQFAKGCGAVKTYAFIGFLNTTMTVSLNLLFLLVFDWGIKGYLYAYIIGSVVTVLYLVLRLKLYRYIRLTKRTDYGLLKSMLAYSIPMIPNSMCWWINNSLDRYVLLAFYNVSVLGVYAAANKIPSLLTVFTGIFVNAWQLSSIDDFGTEKNREFFSNVYRKYSSFVLCGASLIVLCSGFLTRVLLSKEYSDAEGFAQVLVFAFVFQAMSAFLGTVYTASKRTTMLFVSTLVGALLNLSLNYLMIPKFGCYGAAVATAISYIAVWSIRLWKTKSILVLSVNLKRDLLCYALIAGECVLMTVKVPYYLLYTALVTVGVLAVNFKELREMLKPESIKQLFSKRG